MDKTTLRLLVLALEAKEEDKKRVLPYFKRALTELTNLVNTIEEGNAREQKSAPQAQNETQKRRQAA